MAPRIALTPQTLRDRAIQLRRTSKDLKDKLSAAQRGYQGLDWEVRSVSQDIERSITSASRSLDTLTRWLDAMAQMLDASAQGFENVDGTAGRNFDRIVDLALTGRLAELERYDPLANVPINTIIGLLTAGDLRQVGRVLLDAIPLPQLRVLRPVFNQRGEPYLVTWGANGWQDGRQDPRTWDIFNGQVPPIPLAGLIGGGISGVQGFLDGADHSLLNSLRNAVKDIPGIGGLFGQAGVYAPNGQGVIAGAVGSLGQMGMGLGEPWRAGASVWEQRVGNQQLWASAQFLSAGAYAFSGLQADILNGRVGANLSAGAKADLIAAQAGGQFWQTGDHQFGTSGGWGGQAYAGAHADARAGLQLDAQRGQVQAGARVDAFVGAEATAQAQASATLAGVNLAAVGHASARAGFGFNAELSGNLDLASGKVGVKANLGAALGIGFDVGVDVQLDVGQAVNNVKDFVVNAIPKIQLPKIELPRVSPPWEWKFW